MADVVTLFSLYDQGAQFFNPPMAAANVALLKRGLDSQLRVDPAMPMFEYPDEFVIYELGTYDQISGEIVSYTPPRRVGSIAELMVRRVGTVPPLDVTVPTDTNPQD